MTARARVTCKWCGERLGLFAVAGEEFCDELCESEHSSDPEVMEATAEQLRLDVHKLETRLANVRSYVIANAGKLDSRRILRIIDRKRAVR